jgi:hypothetical protein
MGEGEGGESILVYVAEKEIRRSHGKRVSLFILLLLPFFVEKKVTKKATHKRSCAVCAINRKETQFVIALNASCCFVLCVEQAALIFRRHELLS